MARDRFWRVRARHAVPLLSGTATERCGDTRRGLRAVACCYVGTGPSVLRVNPSLLSVNRNACVLKVSRDLHELLRAHDEECVVVATTAEDDYGVASSIRVLPPSWRASSMPASARFIHSVTRSSVSSPGRAVDSATTALMVKSCAPQEGWTVEATWRSFSARALAFSKFVSGRMKTRDHAVYFTATSVWRTAEETARASCSMK